MDRYMISKNLWLTKSKVWLLNKHIHWSQLPYFPSRHEKKIMKKRTAIFFFFNSVKRPTHGLITGEVTRKRVPRIGQRCCMDMENPRIACIKTSNFLWEWLYGRNWFSRICMQVVFPLTLRQENIFGYMCSNSYTETLKITRTNLCKSLVQWFDCLLHITYLIPKMVVPQPIRDTLDQIRGIGVEHLLCAACCLRNWRNKPSIWSWIWVPTAGAVRLGN